MGKMKSWDFWSSIISSVIYLVVTEDKTSIWAFMAIMTYLFRIDNKIDEKK